MDKLPQEILEMIAGYASPNTSCNLTSFALLNRRCFHAASPGRFRRILITTKSGQEFIDEIRSLIRRLNLADAFHHVHDLDIYTCILVQRKDTCALDPSYGMPQRKPLGPKSAAIDAAKHEQDPWTLLITLLHALPNLKDFQLSGAHIFPKFLLHTLHEVHPECRIHCASHLPLNWHFDPQCIPNVVPMEEAEFARSPLLHSVQYRCLGDFNHQAPDSCGWPVSDAFPMHMVAGIAPNLKEASCLRMTRYMSPPPNYHPSSTHGVVTRTSQSEKGSLEYLKIEAASDSIPVVEIKSWMSYTDFSVLKTLHLEQVYQEASTFDYLTDYADLRNIQSLTLWTNPQNPNSGYTTHEISESTARFIRSLPPLKTLKITAWTPNILPVESFLRHHGTRLRCLELKASLGISLGPEEIRLMAECCPHLEELTIGMRRNYGDQREVACYKALGSFARLDTLNIELDASGLRREPGLEVWDPERPKWAAFDPSIVPNHASLREFDAEPFPNMKSRTSQGYIRGLLINSAVDEDLARSIFELVSTSGKDSGKSTESRRSVPLARLFVSVNPLDYKIDLRLKSCVRKAGPGLNFVANSWTVEKYLLEDEPVVNCLTVDPNRERHVLQDERFAGIWRQAWSKQQNAEETNSEARGMENLESGGDVTGNDLEKSKTPQVPHGKGQDWLKEWHSLPLQCDID